ncbi:MAG TPA: type II secretion system F family protein [Verrucomicrobiae bacterium]|nr:type II secretion system F family protein [Verrucomicrobiae bacterium]
MPLIFMPRQFTLRAHFYQQFGQLLAAGLPVINALEMLGRSPPAHAYREPIRQMISQLSEGATVSDAVQHLGHWMPAFDIALVQAGEHSGRLDTIFKLLAAYYNDRAALLRRMLSDLAYPALLFHMAILLFPFIAFFSNNNLPLFLWRTLGILIPLYVGIFLMVKSMQGRRGAGWRALVERALSPVPVLGPARHFLALSRLSAALEALLNAGVTIIQAWEMAATASGSPAILKTVLAWKPQVEAGQTPSEAVNGSSQFPELFANLYHSGEISGQLDDSLRRLRDYYQEEGSRRLHLLSQWVPRFIYFAVAGYIAYKVIAFYTAYFREVGQAGGF